MKTHTFNERGTEVELIDWGGDASPTLNVGGKRLNVGHLHDAGDGLIGAFNGSQIAMSFQFKPHVATRVLVEWQRAGGEVTA